MTKLRTTIAVTSVIFGFTSLMSPMAAQAASNAATIQEAFAPTANAINSGGPNAYYNTWLRYVGTGSPKPGFGDEALILGKGDAKSQTGRPYSYAYTYSAQFDQKKPSTVLKQGIATTAELGGSWMRRGNLTGILPATISRLPEDTIVTNLQTNRTLARQATHIKGQTPEQKANSMVNIGTAYPVREGSLISTQATNGMTVYRWLTGQYTNSWGDTCDGSEITAYIHPQANGGQLAILDFNETNCRTSSGQPVSTYNDASIRPWNALVGNAPEPNVRLGN